MIRYRTFAATLVLSVLLLLALRMCLSAGNEIAERMFGTLAWSYVLCVAALAGHGIGTAAAAGPGLKGAAQVLWTDRKPGEQAAPSGQTVSVPAPIPGSTSSTAEVKP